MANHVTHPRSGENWTARELSAFNISIVQKDERSFVGDPLPTYAGPLGFIQYEHPVPGLDELLLSLMQRSWLAERIMPSSHESAVFTAENLQTLGYKTKETVVCTQKIISLNMCRQRVDANADVCLMDHHF